MDYRAAGLAKDVTDAAAVSESVIQRCDYAHDEGVAGSFEAVALLLVKQLRALRLNGDTVWLGPIANVSRRAFMFKGERLLQGRLILKLQLRKFFK